MPKITVSELSAIYSSKKSDDVVALDGLNAEFISDAFNVIAGYSGCGKTTLLKCIAGLCYYDGNIFFDNVDVGGLAPSESNISYVSQEFVLYPHLTVFDNIAFPLKVAGAPKKRDNRQGKENRRSDGPYVLSHAQTKTHFRRTATALALTESEPST